MKQLFYADSEWGDLLTSYNGTAITYDEIGNPLSYYNGSSYTFTWNGRKLATAVKDSNAISFAYDDNGIRVSKTVNSVTTHYVYSGNLLISEYTNSDTIVYIYDANDTPIGFKYRANSYAADTWDVYWYGKNLQGDIAVIYSSTGTELVNYTYTAWGKTEIAYYNSGASTTAVKNNLTYRGYYYDNDLSMYYLQSRYYDPAIGRFISPDTESVLTATPIALTDKNLFAYCDNNPVMRIDEDGEFWGVIIAGAVVGGIISGAVSAVSQWLTSGEVNMDEVLISAAAGALSGALASTGIGAVGSGIVNAAIDGIEYMAIQTVNGEEIDESELFTTMFVSSITAGEGINGSKLRNIYQRSNEVLKTAISETKIAMYTAKKAGVIKKVTKEIGETLFEGVVSIGYDIIENRYEFGHLMRLMYEI